MKTILLVLATVFITGCSGLIQTGSVTRAYESYAMKDYPRTLEMIALAQNVDNLNPELNAELLFLKAETYAQLGKTRESENLFRSLAKNHGTTEYGFLAHEKLTEFN